jgi:predicted AlkP superfamily pyrophosphatase or phosphodiesterase
VLARARVRASTNPPPRARLLLAALLTLAARPAVAAAPAPPPPKLVLFIVVDQLGTDSFQRAAGKWKHGLRRLLDGGAVFPEAQHPYLETVTCAGHATLATGAYPSTHGMVANVWWDREREKAVACTDDEDAPLIGYWWSPTRGGASARRLIVPTLGDEMKAQLAQAPRVVSLSLKARSAVTLGGHRADVVAWLENGGWATSEAYTRAVVPWLAKTLRQRPMAAERATPWTRLLPAAEYAGPDDGPGERAPLGWAATFPHPLLPPDGLYEQASGGVPQEEALWAQSPAVDAYLAHLAAAAVREMKLGQGESTDLLAISFPALDVVGHSFGPDSHEAQDVLLRLDVVVGELLAEVDRLVGPGRTLVALGSDHGVSPLPEALSAAGQPAGRFSLRQVEAAVEDGLGAELGVGKRVADVLFNDVYFNAETRARFSGHAGAVAALLDPVRSIPGVAAALDPSLLGARFALRDPLMRAAALSYFPGRSGDVLLVPRPHFVSVGSGTTHGSPYPYDQRVPLVLFGPGVRRGRYPRAVSAADLAPTLARLLGITMARAEGQPLREALAKGR